MGKGQTSTHTDKRTDITTTRLNQRSWPIWFKERLGKIKQRMKYDFSRKLIWAAIASTKLGMG